MTSTSMVAAIGICLAIVWWWTGPTIAAMDDAHKQAWVIAGMALCCYGAGFIAGSCWKNK